MNCPKCNAHNTEGAQWCTQCLTPIASVAPDAPAAQADIQQQQANAAQAGQYPSPDRHEHSAPSPAPQQSGPSRPLIIAIGVALVTVIAIGGYFAFGRSSAETYSDESMNFKVLSFKCGEKSRSVIEGEQGPVAKPRNLVAKGEFCTLQVDITNNLTTSELQVLAAENQKLVTASGEEVAVNTVDIETMSRPNNYYQPGPYPDIEPKKTVEAKVIWDYDPATPPDAAILHAASESPGARIQVKK